MYKGGVGRNSYPVFVVRRVMGEVYRPAEDSHLLSKHVSRLVHGEVLDMGTGSGIQAITAALKQEVESVVAVDINPKALTKAKRWAKEAKVSNKIKFVTSDLFAKVSGNFDWILFNPPYLPSEGTANELSWAGGKDGTHVIKRFLSEAPSKLKKDGSILMVYSSYTKLDETDYNGYKWEILEEKNVFFETLYCVRLNRI